MSLMASDYKLTHNGNVWFKTPNGHIGHVTPDIWTITEEPDGTITVSPSIKMSTTVPDGEQSREQLLFHGYLTKGVWSFCDDSPR